MLTLDRDALDVLDAAQHAYVAVSTPHGPHVTPQLHATWAGRVWVVAPRSALKVRALRRHPLACVTVRAGDRAAVVRGHAVVLDPLRPGPSTEALFAGGALARYALRHHRSLAGFVEEAAGGCLDGLLPVPRVLVAVRPSAVAVVDGDGVIARSGTWPVASRPPATGRARRGPGVDTTGVPLDTGDLVRHPAGCVVGWETAAGPVALPARWDSSRRAATVPGALFALVGAGSPSAACITLDEVDGDGPTDKHGVLVRGAGRAVAAGADVLVTVDPEKVTWWRGTASGTRRVA